MGRSRIQRINRTRKICSRGVLSLVHDRQLVTCHPRSRLPSPPANYLVPLPANTAHDTSTITDTHCIQSFFLISSFETWIEDRPIFEKKKKGTTNKGRRGRKHGLKESDADRGTDYTKNGHGNLGTI